MNVFNVELQKQTSTPCVCVVTAVRMKGSQSAGPAFGSSLKNLNKFLHCFMAPADFPTNKSSQRFMTDDTNCQNK